MKKRGHQQRARSILSDVLRLKAATKALRSSKITKDPGVALYIPVLQSLDDKTIDTPENIGIQTATAQALLKSQGIEISLEDILDRMDMRIPEGSSVDYKSEIKKETVQICREAAGW